MDESWGTTVLQGCYGNMHALTYNFVTSVFIKGYTVEGSIRKQNSILAWLFFFQKKIKIVVLNTVKIYEKKFSLELGNV